MTGLPDPLTPPDCDLRGYDYMPLFGHRLFSSDLYTESTDAEFRAALKLWWSAWQQCPAGSLPNSDRALAEYSGYGRDVKGWVKVSQMALRGFVECSDGRLYHPFLCGEAVTAYALRLKSDAKRERDRERLQAWRDAKVKRDANKDAGHQRGADETGDETRFNTPKETSDEAHFVAGRIDNNRQDKEGKNPPTPKGAASDGEPWFSEFWSIYPKKDDKGHARKAFIKAVKATPAAVIIAGLRDYRFPSNRQYIPLPATWLSGERWLQPWEDGAPANSDDRSSRHDSKDGRRTAHLQQAVGITQ